MPHVPADLWRCTILSVDAVQLGSAVHKPYDSCTNKTSVLLAIVTVKIKTVGLYFVYTVTYIL